MCLEAGGAGQLIMSETGELVNDNYTGLPVKTTSEKIIVNIGVLS